MGKVRWLTMIRLWIHEVLAVVELVTNFQSLSSTTPRKAQSSQETWFGSNSTGPGVDSTSVL